MIARLALGGGVACWPSADGVDGASIVWVRARRPCARTAAAKAVWRLESRRGRLRRQGRGWRRQQRRLWWLLGSPVELPEPEHFVKPKTPGLLEILSALVASVSATRGSLVAEFAL